MNDESLATLRPLDQAAESEPDAEVDEDLLDTEGSPLPVDDSEDEVQQAAETESIDAEDPPLKGAEPPSDLAASSETESVDAEDSPRDPFEVQSAPPATRHPLEAAQKVMQLLGARMKAQVIGRDDVIDLVLVALLADGHVLLEDFPGSGKTTLAKSLGTSILDDAAAGVDPGSSPASEITPFRRIQFTPDLLPSDVTGVSIFDTTSSTFRFQPGPIFAHVVLADEINRTSPKVQAAMLEAMAEKQVTVDNVTYPLDGLFFVIATQNPLDLAGTYPLPVAQLDRFLFKIRMEHIDRDAELEVLATWRDRRNVERQDLPKVARAEILQARRAIDEHVAVDPKVQEALVDIAGFVRADERVLQGCSTRSLVLMLPALQALAALEGRDFVNGDDIVKLAPRVLAHRLELAPGLSVVSDVISDAVGRAIEGLSRSTLRRQ